MLVDDAACRVIMADQTAASVARPVRRIDRPVGKTLKATGLGLITVLFMNGHEPGLGIVVKTLVMPAPVPGFAHLLRDAKQSDVPSAIDTVSAQRQP